MSNMSEIDIQIAALDRMDRDELRLVAEELIIDFHKARKRIAELEQFIGVKKNESDRT